MRSLSLAVLLFWGASADIYMQMPRGSNNRMDDRNRDRDNGRRLFDSQNNARGGYNQGTGQEYYYEGSDLPIEWTAQHSCNGPNSRCEIILQYSCDKKFRNGYWTMDTRTDSIPFEDQFRCLPYLDRWMTDPTAPQYNCTVDYRYGMHEDYDNYMTCAQRKRNMGLFTAEQRLRGPAALYTRQNPDGEQYGLECPEERDYYPYWQPTVWRDIAVLTDTPSRCAAYQAESQNVKPRGRCIMSPAWHAQKYDKKEWGYVPTSQPECENPAALVYDPLTKEVINRGIWEVVPAFGIPAPYCGLPPRSRDNNHGNADGLHGWTPNWNWTLPEIASVFPDLKDSERCVLRIRYNISTTDFNGWAAPNSVQAGVDWTMNAAIPEHSASEIPIWAKYGLPRPVEPFVQRTYDGKEENYTFGRGYVMSEDPYVDIFGLQSEGGLIPGQTRVYLQVAVDTAEFSRTFEDRSHIFAIRRRPDAIKGMKIHNINVNGKRGNIVQTYPGTEFGFYPYQTEIRRGDLIHIQWNGANTNPQNNAGEGPAGTDRHNMMLMRGRQYAEAGQVEHDANQVTWGQWGCQYPAHIGRPDMPSATPLLGFSWKDLYRLAEPSLVSGYFDMGLRQITDAAGIGRYNFMSVRANNFSNRSEKGMITVLPTADGQPVPPLAYKFGSITTIEGLANIKFPTDARRTDQQEIIMEDAGPSKWATNWVKISPYYISIPDKGMYMIEMQHKWIPFTYGRIYWSENKDEEQAQEMFTTTDTWSPDKPAVAQAKITLGGYYVVKYVMNGSAIGGVAFGVAAFAFAAWFITRRFGCKCFNSQRGAAAKEGQGASAGQKESLLAAGATSDSSAAPAAARV